MNKRRALEVVVCGCVVGMGVLLAHPGPVGAFADKKAAGAEQFATRGCAHCHGDQGQGTERGPTLQGLRRKMSADQVRTQILKGGQGMPAFGEILDHEQVEDLLSFLRAKKWETVPAVKPEDGTR